MGAGVVSCGIHQHIAGGVPQFVAEITVTLDAVEIEFDIPPGGGQGGEGEAQRISAEGGNAIGKIFAGGLDYFACHLRLHQSGDALVGQVLQFDAVDEVNGVEDVALGLGHLLTVGIPHQTMDIDFMKRYLASEFQPHHDHPRDPEENDIEAGDQDVGGIKVFQLGGLLGPAQGGERPQGR